MSAAKKNAKRLEIERLRDLILLDEEDSHLRKLFYVDTRGYAVRKNADRVTEGLHRVVMDAPEGVFVDHINGNKLDNRKENLRLVTNAENLRNRPKTRSNTSGYKGVMWSKAAKLWTAQITVNYKNHHLGLFVTAESAALAYNEAAKIYHGVHANLNEVK